MSTPPVTIAVSADFFTAFAVLPRQEQSKVMTFVSKFRQNPTLPGYNYEKIRNARDKRLRSVRVDDACRCILLRPEKGNVYMLLWVDRHDDAYAWARKRRCEIDPATGGIHIVVVEEDPAMETNASPQPASAGCLWETLRDEDLAALGVPESLYGRVRSIRAAEDLAALKESLPSAGYESLLFLDAEEPLADVISLYQSCVRPDDGDSAQARTDPEDFASALRTPHSRQQFFVNPDETALAAMLDAPLEKWRVFLHPSQRALVERDWNGPVRVLGGAGTGKTVVALHRARWLAANRCPAGEKILFTTFTRTLAKDLERQLAAICSPQELGKIDVVSLDRWVMDFLRRNAYEYTIIYSDKTSETLWETARALLPEDSPAKRFPTAFFREEWERVVQPQEVMTATEYFKASRKGRGQALSRKERKEIWPVFEEFRIILNERKERQPADAMREARQFIEQNVKPLYFAVLVDEAQDMSAQALRLLRALTPTGANDIFLVGDAHQRIYGQPAPLSGCGINIVGRARKLRINYRTTEEIRRTAICFLKNGIADDLDGNADDIKKYVSLMHGVPPQERHFATRAEALETMVHDIGRLAEKYALQMNNLCIAFRTISAASEVVSVLKAGGIPSYVLTADSHDDRGAEGVRLSTMHRIKGLEFDVVFILDNASALTEEHTDGVRAEQEKALRYVAATRARRELFIYTF